MSHHGVHPLDLRRSHRQQVVSLVAAGALLLATAAGPPSHTPLALPAVGLVMLALVRWRGRPLVAWIGPAARYAARPRRTSADLLPLLCPEAMVSTVDVSGSVVGAIVDRHGLAAVIELGESADLVQPGGLRIPAPGALLGPPRDSSEPSVAIQVLVVRHGAYQRAFVVVRVGADGLAWTEDRLRPALVAAVRGVTRRLARLGAGGRPLGPAETPAAITWALEGAPGPGAATVEEAWDHLRVDGTLHTTVHIRAETGVPGRLGGLGGPSGEELARLLGLPATVAALAVDAGGMLLRLAAGTPAALAAAVAAAMADAPGDVTHLDGEQRDALAATLPLGPTAAPGNPTRTGRRPDAAASSKSRPGLAAAPAGPEKANQRRDGRVGNKSGTRMRPGLRAASRDRLEWTAWQPRGGAVTVPHVGLKLGHDRHGEPVTLRFDQGRSVPVRLAVVGGPAAARVLAARIRALAPPVPVNLAVFDRPTAADTAALSAADIVVCQRVSPEEAALVATALRLTQAGAWLSRIEGDMVAVIGDGTVRWALLGVPGSGLPLVSGLSALART